MIKLKNAYIKLVRLFSKSELPKFLIVGAQKAGTTSLYHYLNQHPDIIGAYNKEVGFFNRDENYQKGKRWYKLFFKDWKRPLGGKIYFEATPEYLYREDCPKRIYDFDPNMKIIILLRDPVKRAFSSWNMYRDFIEGGKSLPTNFERGYIDGRDNNLTKELYSVDRFPRFDQVVASDLDKHRSNSDYLEPSFVRRGIYVDQVKRYLDLFGKDQVMIFGFQDLIKENRCQVLDEIVAFLGMKPVEWHSFLNDDKKNKRIYTEQMSEEIKAELTSFYTPYNEALFNLIEKQIHW